MQFLATFCVGFRQTIELVCEATERRLLFCLGVLMWSRRGVGACTHLDVHYTVFFKLYFV